MISLISTRYKCNVKWTALYVTQLLCMINIGNYRRLPVVQENKCAYVQESVNGLYVKNTGIDK